MPDDKISFVSKNSLNIMLTENYDDYKGQYEQKQHINNKKENNFFELNKNIHTQDKNKCIKNLCINNCMIF